MEWNECCETEEERNAVDGEGPCLDMDLGEEDQRKYSSSSLSNEEFEFRISVSRTSGASVNPVDLSPADDLFYNGQLLPLHRPSWMHIMQNVSSSERNVLASTTMQNPNWALSSKRNMASSIKMQNPHGTLSPEQNGTRTTMQNLNWPKTTIMQNLFSPPENSATWSTSSSSDCRTREASESWDSVNSQSFWSKDSTSRDSDGSSHDSSECNSPILEEALTNPEEKAIALANVDEKALALANQDKASSQPEDQNFNCKKSTSKFKVSLWGLKKSSKVGMDEKVQHTNSTPLPPPPPPPLKNAEKSKSKGLSPGPALSRDSSSSSNRYQKGRSFLESDGGCKKIYSVSETDIECPDRLKHGNHKGPFQKYFKMMKPLYEKISNKYDQLRFLGQFRMDECGSASVVENNTIRSASEKRRRRQTLSSSSHPPFSGNTKIGRKSIGSCPSSMRSSPNHSGVLTSCKPPIHSGVLTPCKPPNHSGVLTPCRPPSCSDMEELQNAIQGAIAHCKMSNAQNSDKKSEVSS